MLIYNFEFKVSSQKSVRQKFPAAGRTAYKVNKTGVIDQMTTIVSQFKLNESLPQ